MVTTRNSTPTRGLNVASFRRWASLLYLMGAAIFCGCQPPGPKSLLRGEQLMHAGKYPEAIAELQKATQLLPGNAQAWNHLGLANQYAGKPDEALRAYQQAVSLDKNSPTLRYNLGLLHLEQGRANEAIQELTSCMVLQPNFGEALLPMGKALLRVKRIDDAERTLREALRRDKDNVEALNYFGVVQLHRRKATDAMAYFNQALKLDSNYAPAVLNQAILSHHYIINKTNALQRYRDYLAMNPDPVGAATANQAIALLSPEVAPKPPVAAAVVTNLPPPNIVLAPKTNLPPVVALTNKPTVVAIHTNPPTAAKTNPPPAVVATTPPPVTNKPPVQVAAAKVDEPPKAIEKPAEKRIEKPAEIVEEKPEPTKPLEVVKLEEEPAVFAPPKDVAPPKVEEPVKTTPTVVAKAPEPRPVQPAAPPPLIRPVQPEEKSKVLQKVNPLNWFKRGEKESKEEPANKPETKVADIKTLPEAPAAPKTNTPPPAPVVIPEPVFARFPYRTTPLPRAGERAAALPPFNAAVQAHQDGKLGQAMDNYRDALRHDPRFFEAHLNLGIAAAAANDLSLSLAALEDAVRIDPKSAEARYQFANVLRRANYPQDAVNELKALIDESPKEARAHLALGNLYAQVMNKPELAAEHYRKTLELSPQQPQALQIRNWLAQH